MAADGVTPPPHVLWQQADREFKRGEVENRAARYVDLMREAGHIVKAKPGEDRNLPCGWPGLPPAPEADELFLGDVFGVTRDD